MHSPDLCKNLLGIYHFSDELLFKYSSDETGNSVRAEQAKFLIQEINFWGKGLGSVLNSGYYRNEFQPYGFELTFLNILHKFGFLGICIWIAYLICIITPIRSIFSKTTCYYSWFAVGGLLFIVPGYGNPLLFHPTIVVLHCVVMYLIRCSILEKRENKYV